MTERGTCIWFCRGKALTPFEKDGRVVFCLSSLYESQCSNPFVITHPVGKPTPEFCPVCQNYIDVIKEVRSDD